MIEVRWNLNTLELWLPESEKKAEQISASKENVEGRMKKLICFILILSSFFLYIGVLNISCQKGKEEKEEGYVKVITNEGRPQNPSLSLTFVENLSITKEGWLPAEIEVDDEDNIYVFVETEMSIYKFDALGNGILKKAFPKGQGPGDFNFMDPYISSDGKLYIYDKMLRKITTLNKNCEIQETIKIEGLAYILRIDSKGNMIFWVGKSSPSGHKHVLSKFSSSGKLLYEIFEYFTPSPEINEEKMIFSWPLYFTSGIYKLDSDDNIYYAVTDKYEINVVSSEGQLVKRIEKTSQSRKVTKKDIESVTPSVKETAPFKTKFIAPEHVPYIADFFILDNKYLLVVTHENGYDKETLVADLFDEKGIFQTRVEVPKYYQWNIDISTSIMKKKAVYKKNHFYTIEADGSEENFYVKRYKMIWKNK